MSASILWELGRALLRLLVPEAPAPTTPTPAPAPSPTPVILPRQPGKPERDSYWPTHGDSHAFLGSTFATRGISNDRGKS